MSVITISRGSYSHGKEVAEKVARELNYECVSREILLEASKEFNIREIRLLRAIKNAPSFLNSLSYGKEKYVAYIRSTLLEYVLRDNVVYHGFAGHFLLGGVPHVLKVRICARMEERAALIMETENVSREDALKMLEKIDNERKKWAMHFYGKDPWDLNMYDLGLVISRMSIDDAVENVLFTVRRPCFQSTPESDKVVRDLALAAQVKANLIKYLPEANVSVEDGMAIVHIKRNLAQEKALTDDITEIVMRTPGVKDVRVDIIPFY